VASPSMSARTTSITPRFRMGTIECHRSLGVMALHNALAAQHVPIAHVRAELSRRGGIDHRPLHRGYLWSWTIVPEQFVLALEDITGVHRSVLRPDLWHQDGSQITQPTNRGDHD
jgi:hypothetical protein